MAFLIDDTPIKTPHSIEVSPFIISKAERTADGTMQMDIIASKRRIDIGWNMIQEVDIQPILSLLGSRSFHKITYPDPEYGDDHDIIAYRGDVVATPTSIYSPSGSRYWADVQIALIEQ